MKIYELCIYIPPFSFLFASIFGFCKKWFQIGTSTKEFNRNEPLISNPTQPPASIASHLGQVLGWMEMSVAGAGPVDVGERWSLMEGASGFWTKKQILLQLLWFCNSISYSITLAFLDWKINRLRTTAVFCSLAPVFFPFPKTSL